MKYLLSIFFIGICCSFLWGIFRKDRYECYDTFPEEKKIVSQEIPLSTDFRFPYRITIKEGFAILMDLHPESYYYHLFTYPGWQPVAAFGKRGEGPKELLSADGVQFISMDSIYTLDANRMLISRWAFSATTQSVERVEDISLDKELIRSLDFYRTEQQFLIPNYTGQCRYHEVSHTGKKLHDVGTIPTETYTNQKNVALAQAWRTFADYHPKNRIYALVTQLGEVLEIYHLESGKRIVKYGPGGEPRFIETSGRGIPMGIKGFMDVRVTERYIYAIFDGLSWDERRKYQERGEIPPEGGHFLYQFDLKGNPVRKYVLDRNIYGLEIDEKNNRVIAVSVEGEHPIITFQL